MKLFGKTFHISVIIVISLLVTNGKTDQSSTQYLPHTSISTTKNVTPPIITTLTTSTTTDPTTTIETSASATATVTLTTGITRLIEVKYGRDYTASCAEANIFIWKGKLGTENTDYIYLGVGVIFIVVIGGTLIAGAVFIITREEEEEEFPPEDSEQGGKSTTSLSAKSTVTSDEKSGRKVSVSSKKSIVEDAKPKQVDKFVDADKSASFGVSRTASFGAIGGVANTPAKTPKDWVPYDLNNIDPKALLAPTKAEENRIIEEFMGKYGFDLTEPENRKIYLRKQYQAINDNMEILNNFKTGERKGAVFIPREIPDMDMVPLGEEEPVVLEGVKFEDKKDEIYSIGTDVDDVELDADSSIGSSMNSSRAGSLRAHSHRKVSKEPTQRKEKSKRNRMSREKKKERTLENSK